jgi:hypothetical protein
MFFGSALFALLPAVARSVVGNSAIGYGVFLGSFGRAGFLGALILQPARSRWSTETVVSTGGLIVGAVIVTTSLLHRLGTADPERIG